MRVIVVKFTLKPEFRDRFLEASLGDARGANEDEPGCLRFDVIQHESDPNTILFYEVYRDQAAFDAHLQAPHFIKWRDAISPDWYAAPVEPNRGWSIYPDDADWK